MLNARQIAKQETSTYPMATDFCRIFEQNMSGLYRLAFLLTANQHMAEGCFARGLEDAARSNRVFKEWAHSWARRAVIQNAIQMIVPRPTEGSTSSSTSDVSIGHALAKSAEIAAIVELPAFERFAKRLANQLDGLSLAQRLPPPPLIEKRTK